MKILILTNKPPYPSKDGGAIATAGLAAGLADAGNHVHILAINTPKHFSETYSNQFNITVEYVFVDTRINIYQAIYNLFFSKEPYNAIRFYHSNYAEKLIGIIKTNDFDIIQIEGPYMFYYLDIIRNNTSVPVSYRAHNIEHEIWQRLQKGEGNLLKRFYFNTLFKRIKRFEQGIINKYDLLVPIADRDHSILTQMGNTKPALVSPAGINEDILKYKSDLNTVNGLFYIGALDWKPNTEGLKWFVDRVWPVLSEKYSNVSFTIAGRNAPKEFVSFLKRKNVNFLGEIDDAYAFIAKEAIQLVPLFSGSGMRIKIIEGMALGKAIVSTSIGAEGIAATHNRDILIANNQNEFIESISRLINNKLFYNEISKSAQNFATNIYSNTRIGLSLSSFYHKYRKV